MKKTILNFNFDYCTPPLSLPYFLKIPQHFQPVLIIVIFRSLPVPGHSQEWRPLIPFPNFGNGFFSFPSRSQISGMDFFHSLPVPEFWEWIFSFPSRSRISGMDFFHSLPVPEFREWIFSIPFPFPIFGNGFFQFPSRSRIDPSKVGNQKGKWEIFRDASIPTFSASCT